MLKQRIIVDLEDDGIYYKFIKSNVLTMINDKDDARLLLGPKDYWEKGWRQAETMDDVLKTAEAHYAFAEEK